MDMSLVLAWVNSIHPIAHIVLLVLGSLVVVATVYVKLTPSLEDDAMLAKLEAMPVVGALLKALMSFSVIQRKE
jgi:Na+-transporting NADH:ubiquinone oxidoreductase subunit NqrC